MNSSENEHNRLKNLTHLSSLGIILVVFGHSYPTLEIGDVHVIRIMYLLREAVYSFHMHLFFFISGFLFFYTNPAGEKIGFFDLAAKKAKRLLLPYVLISSISFPIKAAMSAYAMRPVDMSFTCYLKSLVFPWDNVIIYFWFLPTLFLLFLISPFIRMLAGHRSFYPKALLLALFLYLNLAEPLKGVGFLNLEGVGKYALYFYLGCLFCGYRDLTARLNPYVAIPVALAGLIAANIYGVKTPLPALAAALCGIVLCYCLIEIYTSKNCRLFSGIDSYSYQIYLLSWFAQISVRVILYETLKIDFFVVSAVSFAAQLILPVVVAKIIARRLPKLRILIGM